MIEHVAIVLLVGISLLLFPGLAATKFAYKPPSEASEADRRAVPRYMSAVVKHHKWFKFGGGLGAWFCFLFLYIVDPAPDWLRHSVHGLLVIAIGLYSLAFTWRMAAIANRGHGAR